jgi:23S rRNA (uridine2552-2'-O)-methyltransferase
VLSLTSARQKKQGATVADKKKSGTGSSAKKPLTSSTRMVGVRVKTARKRKVSSTLWLQRQLHDPYVMAAKRDGYRSRAAYKLKELDEKYGLLKSGMRVVDLGAAPGGWSQVVAQSIFKKGNKTGQLVALDILPMDALDNVAIIHTDFTTPEAPDKIKALLQGEADLVLSDMAASTTGHNATDHLRIIALAEMAYAFAQEVLAPNGAFVCKLFHGGAEKTFLDQLKHDFKTVRHAKPPASRKGSAESYIVALGFRGADHPSKP